jgi:hypothetical protein
MANNYEHYVAYYTAQAEGRGVGESITTGRVRRGDGLGSFLGGLFRKVMPYIKSGASTVGSELLNVGVGLLRDTFKGSDLKSSVKERVTAAGTNLGGKASNKLQSMLGLGYKRKRRTRKRQSAPTKRRKKTPRARSKKTPAARTKKTPRRSRKRDIFGF